MLDFSTTAMGKRNSRTRRGCQDLPSHSATHDSQPRSTCIPARHTRTSVPHPAHQAGIFMPYHAPRSVAPPPARWPNTDSPRNRIPARPYPYCIGCIGWTVAPGSVPWVVLDDGPLARIIHEGFYCNRRYQKSELIAVFFLRARIIQRALDLASAVATHLEAGGFAAQSVNILLGTGALLPGDCPRSESGTGTAADDGASPLTSARPSRLASRRFRHEPS